MYAAKPYQILRLFALTCIRIVQIIKHSSVSNPRIVYLRLIFTIGLIRCIQFDSKHNQQNIKETHMFSEFNAFLTTLKYGNLRHAKRRDKSRAAPLPIYALMLSQTEATHAQRSQIFRADLRFIVGSLALTVRFAERTIYQQ